MIFVITGTERFPFNRMVKKVDTLVSEKIIQKPVFVQLGACNYKPENCKWKRYLSFGEMCDTIQTAETIISHAGAGTTLLCIQMNHFPILVPRRKMYGEHVDDHQLSFSRKFETTGMVKVVYNTTDLIYYIKKSTKKSVRNKESSQKMKLVTFLNDYLRCI